jgi:hypothetical protein
MQRLTQLLSKSALFISAQLGGLVIYDVYDGLRLRITIT